MISLYMPGRSWVHRMPAQGKLGFLFVASLLFIVLPGLAYGAVLLAGVVGAYLSLGHAGAKALRNVRPVLWVVAIILAFHLVLGSYLEGLSVILRLMAMVLFANLISITTPLEEMMDAVEPLFFPLALIGVPVRRISLAVAMVIRFIPVLLGVYASLQEAYFARTGKRNSWQLLAPFALHTLKHAEHVGEALAARGGVDGYCRTKNRKFEDQ